MRAGPTTLKNPEKQTLRKTTIRKSVQLSPKHCVRAGEKTPRCISRRCVACLLRPSGRRFSKVFQSDFSLEDGSWQTTTTGTNTPRFLEVSTKKTSKKHSLRSWSRLGACSFIQDGFANHLIISLGAAPGSKYFYKKVWLQHDFWQIASGLTLTVLQSTQFQFEYLLQTRIGVEEKKYFKIIFETQKAPLSKPQRFNNEKPWFSADA